MPKTVKGIRTITKRVMYSIFILLYLYLLTIKKSVRLRIAYFIYFVTISFTALSDIQMQEATDLITIKKVVAGDISAYSILVEKYKDLAFTLANNIILNREDAEEIVQDAFVKAFKSLNSFKRESKFSTWFYRIVVNTSLNKRKVKKIYTVTDKEETTDEVFFDTSVLNAYRNNEQKRFIKLAMNKLTDSERLCITMFYLNELSVQEIKDITSISAANVKILLYRGRKHLYRHLQELLKTEVKNLI